MANNHRDRKSPKDRVVGPLPNGLSGLWMGVILTTYKSWDDPPSSLSAQVSHEKDLLLFIVPVV